MSDRDYKTDLAVCEAATSEPWEYKRDTAIGDQPLFDIGIKKTNKFLGTLKKR